MKKLLSILLTVVMALGIVSMVGCGKKANYVAKPIDGIEVEQYGFAVGKDSTKKAEIIAAMNKVIDANIEKMDDIVAYWTAISKDETPTKTLDTVDLSDNTAGTLNVYTCSGFEPYEFVVDGDNVVGVDIYLMELVCEELNMKIKVNDVDFDGICGKVAAEDNAVGAAGITINDERKLQVEFSVPYYSSVQCIISLENQAYTKLSELAGKKIGVQKGTTGALLVEKAINEGELKDTGATMIEYDTGAVAFTALKAGKIDFIVLDELPAQKLAGK